jgi:hypothetical protein
MIDTIVMQLGIVPIGGKVLFDLLWTFFCAIPSVLWFLWKNFWHINISQYAKLKQGHEKREFYIVYGIVNVLIYGSIAGL